MVVFTRVTNKVGAREGIQHPQEGQLSKAEGTRLKGKWDGIKERFGKKKRQFGKGKKKEFLCGKGRKRREKEEKELK